MASDGAMSLQERLRSHLSLLRSESGILDRVVHKGKNQHRRCPYFKSVLKVRRDVKLLLSAGVEDILGNLFRVIDGTPEQRLRMLEGMKKKHVSGKYNFHERLLGVARLLSQMTEPILVAAVQISALLARSFFMGYSLIILSLLARMRVLLQQAYREYHPPCREFLRLKCVWERDKFVLHEEMDNSLRKTVDNNIETPSLPETPAILYEILEVPTEGQEPSIDPVNDDFLVELATNPLTLKVQLGDDKEVTKALHHEHEDDWMNDGCSSPDSVPKVALVKKTNLSQGMEHPFSLNASGSKVAFIPVRKAASPRTNVSRPKKKARVQSHLESDPFVTDESEDPFFKLLTTGTKRAIVTVQQ